MADNFYFLLSETTASSSGAGWLVKARSCLFVFRGFQPHKTSHRFQRWYLTAELLLIKRRRCGMVMENTQ
jgi:hypothetical protein